MLLSALAGRQTVVGGGRYRDKDQRQTYSQVDTRPGKKPEICVRRHSQQVDHGAAGDDRTCGNQILQAVRNPRRPTISIMPMGPQCAARRNRRAACPGRGVAGIDPAGAAAASCVVGIRQRARSQHHQKTGRSNWWLVSKSRSIKRTRAIELPGNEQRAVRSPNTASEGHYEVRAATSRCRLAAIQHHFQTPEKSRDQNESHQVQIRALGRRAFHAPFSSLANSGQDEINRDHANDADRHVDQKTPMPGRDYRSASRRASGSSTGATTTATP